MRNLQRCLLVFLLLGSLLLPVAPASAGFSEWLDEANATLDRVNSSLGTVFGTGVNPNAEPQPTVQTPKTDALFGGIETNMEKSMGKNAHDAFRKDPGFSTNKAQLERVGRIARRLVPQCERKDISYTFAVLKTKEVNAFAAAGGYIYVTQGLLDAVGSDDELACVIAHELGHVNKKHTIRQAEKAGLMTALVALMGLKDETKKYQTAAAIAAFFANQKFSRNDEFEADRMSVQYAYKAGYNPNAMVRFFERINRDNNLSKFTKYFSTHPPTNDRIKKVQEEIKKVSGHDYVPVSSSGSGASSSSGSSSNSSYGTSSNTGSTSTTGKPTSDQLKAAYEVYLYKKQVYEYKVSQQAPYDEVMKAFNEYQAAKKRYLELKAAAGN
ncbi:MAG: M48 family metalloprotease [Candidatus Riflebacteria bacterium]|nr:M48 family metalloprotease [Candidatus Riflebacteria bacterium]